MREHNNSFLGEKPKSLDFLFLGHFRPWPFASPPGKRTRFNQNEGGKRIRDGRYTWNPKRTESEKIQSVQKVAVYKKKLVIKMSPICLSLIQVLSFYILPFPTPVFCPEMIFSTRVSFDPEMSQ